MPLLVWTVFMQNAKILRCVRELTDLPRTTWTPLIIDAGHAIRSWMVLFSSADGCRRLCSGLQEPASLMEKPSKAACRSRAGQ